MDVAHRETDERLKKLEKKIRKIYRQADKNARKKFLDYMADFYRKDLDHQNDVASGKWTKEEYKNWRKNQLLYANTLQNIRDTIAEDLKNADKLARKMIYNEQTDVYASNYNYGVFEVEKGARVDTSFTLYDHDTVERLIRDNPQLLPKPSAKRQREIDASNLKWNKQKLSGAFTASILSGDSIPKMATRISQVASMNENQARRNARTMTTSAESAGRINSYKRAENMGINLRQEWVATLDGRTRDSHRILDGETIKIGEKFSNGLRYPGDPTGAAGEVYNCRCTVIAVVDGIDPMAFDKSDTLKRKYSNADITYDSWKQGHKKVA